MPKREMGRRREAMQKKEPIERVEKEIPGANDCTWIR